MMPNNITSGSQREYVNVIGMWRIKREERNCPVKDNPSLIYSKIQTNAFYLLIRATALVALVLTTEASDKTTKLKIIIIKPFLYFKIVTLNITFVS